MSVYSNSFTQRMVSCHQEKVIRHAKRQETTFEKTEQTSEPDSDMAGMLGLSDWEIKMLMINVHRSLKNQVDSATH